MRLGKEWTTHLPVLMKALSLTDGPVLELGTGIFSTTYLHWACFEKRLLVSCESIDHWFQRALQFENELHKIIKVDDWNKLDIDKPWDVVLVDNEPAIQRKENTRRLSNLAKYLILHDSERHQERVTHYSEIYPLFKYRYDYKKVRPNTTIVSNFIDLTDFM